MTTTIEQAKWSFSFNDRSYYGEYDTRHEAIAEGFKAALCQDEIWIGRGYRGGDNVWIIADQEKVSRAAHGLMPRARRLA